MDTQLEKKNGDFLDIFVLELLAGDWSLMSTYHFLAKSVTITTAINHQEQFFDHSGRQFSDLESLTLHISPLLLKLIMFQIQNNKKNLIGKRETQIGKTMFPKIQKTGNVLSPRDPG